MGTGVCEFRCGIGFGGFNHCQRVYLAPGSMPAECCNWTACICAQLQLGERSGKAFGNLFQRTLDRLERQHMVRVSECHTINLCPYLCCPVKRFAEERGAKLWLMDE
jgi:hypothetical protein